MIIVIILKGVKNVSSPQVTNINRKSSNKVLRNDFISNALILHEYMKRFVFKDLGSVFAQVK